MNRISQGSNADFTEANYQRLLVSAANRFVFCDYGDEPEGVSTVAWRHDVDYSPQRALALANLEHAKDLRCIYHVLVSSRYYSILEPEVAEIFKKISKMGHILGLHFDMDVFGQSKNIDGDTLLHRIAFEKNILEIMTGAKVKSFSFHNYCLNQNRLLEQELICGMMNIASPSVRNRYKYVSDSNGIWRYERLEDVLAQQHQRIHVLTHPEWWTVEPMNPLARLDRCIQGRAQAGRSLYVDLMKRDGRYDDIASRIGIQDLSI